ncbi:MAG: PHB depolymerase family esterase [Bacteroidota bacterium]|nr:PHB depolymerase family esterase [Bacteroidota bacterium]
MKKLLLILLCLPSIGFGQDGPFYFNDNSIQREFYLHIPNNLPTNSPIVYVFHGWGGSGSSIMSTTAFNILSDQNNFAVCYPTALIDGDNGNSGLTSWNCNGLSDVNFILALNDSLQNQHHFNENKIFATGFSYGGDMSFHLARCQNSNIFDAIAPLAGTIFDYMDICLASSNISVLILHGTNDNVINYNGGNFPNYGPYMSAPDIVTNWVNHNSCSLDTSYSLLDINNDNNITDVTKYHNINTEDKVWFYKVNNGLHTWFDVAPWGNDDFWASEEIWNFFNQIYSSQTHINEPSISLNKKLVRTINVFGQLAQTSTTNLLFYIYDNGTVEKRIIIK